METIFKILEINMTPPTDYGWFHLTFMLLIILATVLITVFFKESDDKVFRRIILISWIIMVSLEVYKQFVFTFSYSDGKISSDYQWYAFPYQFCSTPLYVLPFIAFLKDGKLRDFFSSYICSFSLFAGIVVFFYPNTVFCDILGINVQTMVHHGLQVVLGVFVLIHERKKLNVKYFLKAVAVFVIMVAIAVILNEAVFYLLRSNGLDDTFNMFFISSHFPADLPVLSTIYEIAPYPIYLFAYVFGFSLASFIVLSLGGGIIKLAKTIQYKKYAKN